MGLCRSMTDRMVRNVLLPGGVEETEAVVGARPVAELDLAAYSITAGEGTAQEPYR